MQTPHAHHKATSHSPREHRFNINCLIRTCFKPPAPDTKDAGIDPCGHRRGHAASIDAAMKPLCAAIASITPLHSKHSDTPKGSEGVFIDSIGTYGRMAATPAIEEGEFA